MTKKVVPILAVASIVIGLIAYWVLRNDDDAGAIKKITEAVTAKPDLIAGWEALAKLHLRGKDYKSAITEAKKALGTVHIALGDSANEYGGLVECEVHLDGLVMAPTVEFDGVPVIVDGRHVYDR